MIDPVTKKEYIRFLIPTVPGCLSYVAATLAARFISAVPRHVYIGRLAFLVFFLLLIWVVYIPLVSIAFSGPDSLYFELGGPRRGLGTKYGMSTHLDLVNPRSGEASEDSP